MIILNIVSYTKKLIPLFKQSQKPIWTDLHDYNGKDLYHQDYIDAADYIFMSSDNLDNYRAVMEKTIRRGKKLVICTHGKGGSTALTVQVNGSMFQSLVPIGCAMPMERVSVSQPVLSMGILKIIRSKNACSLQPFAPDCALPHRNYPMNTWIRRFWSRSI